MRRARPSELKEDAVPALVLSIDPPRLRELFPVRFSRVDSFAEPEPSTGALIQLDSGPYAVVTYGKETGRATISFPVASDVRFALAALMREISIHRDEIEWIDESVQSVSSTTPLTLSQSLLTGNQQFEEFALVCLMQYSQARRPRLGAAASVFVAKAKENLRIDHGDQPEDVTRLKREIAKLIDDHEAKTKEILAETDWTRTLKIAINWIVRRYGGSEIAGRSAEDHIVDAILQLVERRRHFPHDQGVTVVAFLVETVRSNVNHLLKRQKREFLRAAARKTGVKDRPPADNHAEQHGTNEAERFKSVLEDEDLASYARFRAEHEGLTAAERAQALRIPEAVVRALDALERTA